MKRVKIQTVVRLENQISLSSLKVIDDWTWRVKLADVLYDRIFSNLLEASRRYLERKL